MNMMKQPNGTCREIRFVLPRQQQNGKTQFLFQGQHTQLVVKDVPYQQTRDHTKSKASPTNKIRKVDDDKELQWLLKPTNETPHKKKKEESRGIKSDIETTPPKLKRTLSDTIDDILSTKKKKSKKARKLERREKIQQQLDSEKRKSSDEKQQHEESSVTKKSKQAQKLDIETPTNQ